MAQTKRLAAVSGLAAALSMAATPLAAAELPTTAPRVSVDTPGVFDKDSENAQRHRWYRYRRHRHVDAGDVLAGVLIIGGIAAIAGAASKADRRDRDYRYRDRTYRDRPYDYRERRGDSRYNSGQGIDRAVDRCVSQIERDVRVDTVDSVDRTGEGWRVTGTIYNGDRFTCRIGQDGRVEDIDYGRGFAASEDRQWNDDRYAAAWRDVDSGKIARPETTSKMPAYPGGPVDSDLQQDGVADDGRYSTAEAPDFTG
ncbi:hypothetical protein [Altererythrobacter sp.]|uniref:hypothetical protein n=1 Tax=Altererythrobacter sp. TaxID=1872480 RepID=UPI003D05381F